MKKPLEKSLNTTESVARDVAREIEHGVAVGVENAREWAQPRVDAAVSWFKSRGAHS